MDHAAKAQERALKVFDAHHQATSAYPAFQKAAEKLLDAITSADVALTAVTPPPSMEKAHENLLKAYRQDYELGVFIRENLRLKEPYLSWWRGWEKRGVAEEDTYQLWLVAVKAQAVKLGVKIPARLHAVM
jgi:hypothetical protein